MSGIKPWKFCWHCWRSLSPQHFTQDDSTLDGWSDRCLECQDFEHIKPEVTLGASTLTFQGNVLQWAFDRGILQNGTVQTQALKLSSESGEVCDAIAKHDYINLPLEIGDCAVLLVIIAELAGLDFQECCEAAWEKIKDRKGFLNEQGVFVKEEDIAEETESP